MNKIKILLVDDHKLVRMGLMAFLGNYSEMVVVGEAANGEEALQQAQALDPDIILMDLIMPKLNGVDAIKELKRKGHPCKIIILTSVNEKDLALAGIKAGAFGYLMKDVEPRELLQAIRDAMDNKPSLAPEIIMNLMNYIVDEQDHDDLNILTNREKEVLRLIADGLSNKEIAAQLFCSVKTVKTHVSSILQKLNVVDRTQAALKAVQKGLVSKERCS